MAGEIHGFLHIIRVDAPVDPVNAEYRVAFTPLGGRLRGRHVTRQGVDDLTDFAAGSSLRLFHGVLAPHARRRSHVARHGRPIPELQARDLVSASFRTDSPTARRPR